SRWILFTPVFGSSVSWRERLLQGRVGSERTTKSGVALRTTWSSAAVQKSRARLMSRTSRTTEPTWSDTKACAPLLLRLEDRLQPLERCDGPWHLRRDHRNEEEREPLGLPRQSEPEARAAVPGRELVASLGPRRPRPH